MGKDEIIYFRVDDELKRKLAEAAEARKEAQAVILREAVREYFARREATGQSPSGHAPGGHGFALNERAAAPIAPPPEEGTPRSKIVGITRRAAEEKARRKRGK